MVDVIIVGGGPAGLSAAIYAARAKYRVLVLEKEKMGGQITITSEIVNYPGVEKTDGTRLTEAMRLQAEAFGAEFLMAEVTGMEDLGDVKKLKTSKGDMEALGVVLALGANPRKLGFAGEREFQGRGVAYCATCDGEFFTGMDVFVIGGGYAAAEEAVFLTRYARRVTIVIREPDFTCAKSVADAARSQEKIEVVYNSEIVEAKGDGRLQSARFRNHETGEEWVYEAEPRTTFGIFVFAGYVPDTDWLKGLIELDEQGYVVTDMNRKTSLDGVYGAGDVCVKNLRQVVTAVSDGAVAATSLERVVADARKRLHLPEREDMPDRKTFEAAESSASAPKENGRFLTGEIVSQLEPIFKKFENKVILKASLDNSPLSKELEKFLEEMRSISPLVETVAERVSEDTVEDDETPVISLCDASGRETGLQFHGVPGGHEFNSFVIGMYNVAGPGQQLEDETARRIAALKKPHKIRVMVSLSCTMCPTTVTSCQKIAAVSPAIEAWMYDFTYYPELKDRYQIMSVPCMIVDDRHVEFGKKTVEEVLDILEKCEQG